MKTTWILRVNTESSDHYIYAFDHMPSDEAIEAFLYNQMPDEYEFVGFVHWSLSQEEVLTAEDISEEKIKAYKNFLARPKDA